MRNKKSDRQMEFSRSIIDGVEIKRCMKAPHACKPHVHQELSLGYILDGSTNLSMNDSTILYQSGDGVIIPPLITHICAPDDIDHWSYIMLFIDPGYYKDLVSYTRAKKLTGNQARKLKAFIEKLLTETNASAMENILVELLLEFGDKELSETVDSDTNNAIKYIHDYIIEHVSEDITLEKLEQLSGLNKFSIIRNFKKTYVTTPAAYHLQYRVAEAKSLLVKGADTFDICDELGFYDQAHFIREFKKMYGITPVAYLAQLKD